MCGIVAYSGIEKKALEVIISGLEKLEYRGYDSAGIAIIDDNDDLIIEKKLGKLENLEKHLNNKKYTSKLGIGHTRWATHGIPSDKNSHPHLSFDKNVAVVHNGIIENYLKLKEDLINEGISFNSETDTELIAHLFEKDYKGDLLEASTKLIKKIRGSYALAIVHKKEKDTLVCIKNESPLVIGVSKDKTYVASDALALLKYTKDFIYLEDNDICIINKGDFEIFDENGNKVTREIKHLDLTEEKVSKQGFEHFMLKEINEQPKIIKDTLKVYVDENNKIDFKKYIGSLDLLSFEKIYVVACGTAYHAGLQFQFFAKHILKKEVNVEIASEFRYDMPFLNSKSLVVIISQSGETYDSLMALRLAKENKAHTLAICNVLGSTIAREADNVIYTLAGPEISVASTKAYTSQVTLLYLLTLYFSKEYSLDNLLAFPDKLKQILENDNKIKELAKIIYKENNLFYLGRLIDEKIAREASLKLKEITYIHSESFPTGELKHGSIALIEKNTPVIFISTIKDLASKTLANIKEVKARGANVICFTIESSEELKKEADFYYEVENIGEFLTPNLVVVCLQLLAYYVANYKGLDVDKPRNLAKSVTVE